MLCWITFSLKRPLILAVHDALYQRKLNSGCVFNNVHKNHYARAKAELECFMNYCVTVYYIYVRKQVLACEYSLFCI